MKSQPLIVVILVAIFPLMCLGLYLDSFGDEAGKGREPVRIHLDKNSCLPIVSASMDSEINAPSQPYLLKFDRIDHFITVTCKGPVIYQGEPNES